MRLFALARLTLPGLAVGFIAGVVAGGLAAFVGQPAGWALVSALTLGIPLGLLGAGYTMLLIIAGTPSLPPDPLGFLAYQGIVSAGFAIGFLWLHERVAPRYWARLAEHDPRAREVYLRYAGHAQAMVEANERRRAARGLKP